MSDRVDLREQLAMQGHLFLVGRRSVDQPAASTTEFLIKVSTSALYVSIEVAAEPGSNFWIELYEGPTTTADGTATTPRNMNRTSDETLLTTCHAGPTVTANGTFLFNCVCTGDRGGGGTHHTGLWVLAASTNYLLRITNAGAAAADCGYSLQMHERP